MDVAAAEQWPVVEVTAATKSVQIGMTSSESRFAQESTKAGESSAAASAVADEPRINEETIEADVAMAKAGAERSGHQDGTCG